MGWMGRRQPGVDAFDANSTVAPKKVPAQTGYSNGGVQRRCVHLGLLGLTHIILESNRIRCMFPRQSLLLRFSMFPARS